MTTNTPPISPKSSSKKKSSSDKKSSSSTSKQQSSSADTVLSGASTSGRMLRYSGYEGETALARPLVIDDFGVIPSEHVESTFLTLKRSVSDFRGEEINLEGSTDRLELVARNSGSSSWPFKYALAIVPSDESEAVRVWDAEVLITEKRVKRLKAVEESDAARLGASVADSAASSAIDYKTAQNLLGEAFGTRKRKQAIVSLEKNKVRADSLGQPAAEFISQTLSEAKPDETSNSTGANEDVMASSLLPPFNKETLDVCDIYAIKDLIPSECYKVLPVDPFVKLTVKSSKDEIEAVQARFNIKDFWLNRILSAPRDDGGHTLRLLLFGHFLTNFRELREAALNGPDGSVAAVQNCLLECPETVIVHLLGCFADRIAPASLNQNVLDKAKHKLPNTLRDKIILFILVVLLHLDGFRVNSTSIAEMLSVTPTKLVTFFRALGCTIDRPARGEESNVNINNRLVPVKYARLTAPLTFPLPLKRQGKK